VEDLDSVVNYFKSFKDIVLLGGSLGAIPATIVSILNKRVISLITVNGFFGMSKLGKEIIKTYYLYRFLALINKKHRQDYRFFKINFLPEKIKIPILVIYTKNDDVVNPIQSEIFFSKLQAKRKKISSLTLKKHNLTGEKDINKVIKSICDWISYKD